MSRNKSKDGTPINDGNNSIISVCSGNTCTEVKNVTYVCEDSGSICFGKKGNLLFNLILNADILSIVPKVDLKVNKNNLKPGSMYILDIADKISCEGHEFIFKENSEEESVVPTEIPLGGNDFPPDITQEIKVSSFSNKSTEKDDNSENLDLKKKGKVKKEKTKKEKTKKEKIKKEKKPKKKKEKSVGKKTALFKLDKEKASLDADQKSANPLVRVLAILLDIGIAFIILEFIVIDPEILALLKLENLPDLSQFSVTKASIEKMFSIPLVFYISRLIGTLIFGVSLGQMFIGISETSSVLGKRLKGPLREIIGILTGGFILLDLPCLVGKRTFKEFVTSSKLVSSGFLKTFALGTISFIVFSVVWLTLPILNSPNSLKSIAVEETILNSNKKSNIEIYKKSDFFNIAVSSEENVLPFFYYKRSGKSIIGQPELIFYKDKTKSTIKFIKKIDYRKALANVKENNVIIKNFFPEVATILFDPKIRSLNRSAIREVMKLTKESFNLNLDTVVDHVLTRGPFVAPYLDYRFALESAINSNFTKISYANIANYPYMVFHKTKNAKRVMGISLSEANIFDIQTRDKNFEKSLIASNKKIEAEDSLLNLVDILYQKKITDLKLRKAFEISFKFLEAAYRGDVEVKKEEILNSFESQFNYLNLIKKTLKVEDEKNYIDKYVQNLSDLLRAYKENDANYFGDSSGLIEGEIKEEVDNVDLEGSDKGEQFE